MSSDEIFNNRKNKFLRIGRNKGFISNLDEISSLKNKISSVDQFLKSKKTIILSVGLALISLSLIMLFL
jgi:acetyl-CoA carboxylase carboxyl transferase subunit alpha